MGVINSSAIMEERESVAADILNKELNPVEKPIDKDEVERIWKLLCEAAQS